jgi:hypothetical protein
MIEHSCGWSKWQSEGLPASTPGPCESCGLFRSYGDVKRCMLKPTKQKPQKTVKTVPAVQETRVDWFQEFPCPYRAGEPQKKTCGCGGTGVVYMMDCTETTGKSCVATELQRKGLLKKHPDLYHSVRVCEDCPLAKVVPVAPDLPAEQSPSH